MDLFALFGKKSNAQREADEAMAYVAKVVFPNGQTDIERDVQAIGAIFGNKLRRDEATRFVTSAKVLIRIAEDKSPQRIVPRFMRRAGRKVTKAEAYEAYVYLSNSGLSYSGGDGSSAERAVVVSVASSTVGIPAAYAYLERQYGKVDKDWRVALRANRTTPAGQTIETFNLVLKDGSRRTVYFDVTTSGNSESLAAPRANCGHVSCGDGLTARVESHPDC